MNPVVSVIVPVYNCGKYINKCIASIANQTLCDFELIVVDDGSKDDSVGIIEETITHEKLDDKTVLIKQKNKGVSNARNNALDIAKGEYIVFIDGDDYVDEYYLEMLVGKAKEYDSDVIICGYHEVDDEGKLLKTVTFDGDIKKTDFYKMMTTCMRIVKKDLIVKHNARFPENVRGEDIPFNMIAYAYGRNIRMIKYVGYYYVQHNSSAMKKMVGLSGVNFPISEIAKIVNDTYDCSQDIYVLTEYAMLRSYAMFIFMFGRKSEKKELYRIIDEVQFSFKSVKGKYRHNPLKNCNDFGTVQKYAVKMLCFFDKLGMLKPFAYLFTRW